MKNYYHTIIFAVMLASASLQAVADDDKVQWESRFHALSELIDKSSVSKQVLNSNNESSMQKYKLAQSLRDQAIAAYHAGKFDESNTLIGQAKKALFEAAKLSSTRENRIGKEKANYDSMKRSMNALLEAMERVGIEKGRKKQIEQIAGKSRDQIRSADQYVSSGKYKEGIALLGKTMHETDNEISKMRSGDTLTRALSFATPRDEYQYELERNNSHMMLAKAYLAENPAEGQARTLIEQHLSEAGNFRSKAEGMAASGKYEDAVREMESSTVNIVRAIRAMGVYIPG